MQSDFRTARLELITRHALALGGVVGAEIYLPDPEGGDLRLAARSLVEPASPRGEADLPSLLSPGPPEVQLAAVLDAPGPHPGVLSEASWVLPAAKAAWAEALGAAHTVASRIELPDSDRGIMVFALDRPPGPAQCVIMADYLQEASRVAESLLGGGRRRTSHRLEAVLDIGHAAILEDDLPTTLQNVVRHLREMLQADLAMIMLLDESGEALNLAAASMSEAAKASEISARIRPLRPIGSGSGATGWVVRNLRPALIADIREDPRAEHRGPRGPESAVIVPLIARGKTLGVLRVTKLAPSAYGTTELRLVETLARQIAVAVENARLYDQLREQNNQLAQLARLVESSRDAIFLVDPDRYIRHCNPATAQLFGYSKEDLIGKPVFVIVPEQDREGLAEAIHDELEQSGEWHGEITQRRKDGSEFPSEARVNAVFDDGGERIGSVAIVRDLTRRKMLETQLVQSEKLHSLGVMASGVAHQMNNTLAGVLGQAELLLRATTDSDARRYLQSIIQATEDGAASVRRLSDFARASPSEVYTPVDLVTVANDALTATAPRWRDQAQRDGHIIATSVSAEGPAWVMGSAAELREVLTNVVLNAVDALPSGGSITIQISQAQRDVCLRVTDDGIGMDEEVKQRIFDPFFTTKPFGSGTGLGLALAHGTVQRHGGSITARSEPGVGTTFEIHLPCAKGAGAQEVEQEPVPHALAFRVLVVEDEPILCEQLRAILSLDGHYVRVCDGGQAALAALDREEFDVVITDLGMPGVDGWEVAAAAKARRPTVQVGLVTGWAGELAGGEDLQARGVDFVVSKPYRLQTIRDAVARACGASATPKAS